MKSFNFNRWLISQLRRLSFRVPRVYSIVKDAARLDRGIYQCQICKSKVRNGDYAIDHIRPVIDPSTGFRSWDDYIDRLFCGPEGLQLICHPCHDKKTERENRRRRK